MRAIFLPSLLLSALLLASVGLSAAATDAAGAATKPVAASVSAKAQAGEWVEALILLDDSVETGALAATEAAKPPPYQMQRADYEAHIQRKITLLDGLKYEARKTLSGPDLEELSQYPALPVLHVRIDSAEALARLASHPKVKSIDAVGKRTTQLSQSLPLIQQPAVQGAGDTGAGATVGVLDTGADYTRAAFGSCATPGGACKIVYAHDFTPSDDGYRDDGAAGNGEANGHGTNVSGIVLGVAPDAKVAALDVFRTDGYAYDSDIIAAINWCVTNKAAHNIASINMSLGGGSSTTVVPATDSWGISIQSAITAGIMVVAASGNEMQTNALSLPAAYEGVVSVGAVYDANVGSRSWGIGCTDSTTQADKVACFSNSASFLTLLAPGALINAADITMAGTSQATPHVAGAAAVLKALYPADSVNELVIRLLQGPQVLDTRNNISKPRLDLLSAIGTPPVTLGFTGSVTAISESGGSATLSVSRQAGASGSVSVNYSTASDTATAGVDYTATAGTLTWADGDAGNKTIAIQITNDSQLEANETFAVNLSGPTGGAVLGIATHTVTIVNDDDDGFPSGGAMPAGWTQPGGSDAAWTVATDSTFAGATSLKSGPISDSQSSGLSYTANFTAGTVSFVRRVSSEPDYDYLRFYIDGVMQGQWSGDVAWNIVSFPITAGAHTLLWQYSKDVYVSDGGDAAWIDAVSLPSANTPINGVCGTANNTLTTTAPASGLCAAGAASGIATAPANFSWTCAGQNGGTTASCSAPRGYTVTASAGANGTAAPASQTVAYNAKANITLTPAAGYQASATGCGGALTGLTTYATGPITANCAVTAMFAIADDRFPPSSALPAGYTNPAGSNASWSATTATAYAGTSSLKSGTIGHSKRSDLQYSGNFKAGTVSFHVKTSSQLNGDLLEFYIDGIKKQSWSGEVNWAKVSFPITAGKHTLLWRYVKNGSISKGTDAAWIDSVSLPLANNDLSWLFLLLQ